MSSPRRSWAGEEGIALILAMFMVLVVSLLGAALVSTGRSETPSSLNYKSLSQARYAAESGLHSAANYLIHTYVPPGTDAGDPINVYDMTVSPVTYNGLPVMLSTTVGESNYPVAAKKNAFANEAHGTLMMSTNRAVYTSTARLLAMRQFTDAYANTLVTVQRWEITGIGNLDGAGNANVEVTAIVERQPVPAFRYAAFSTYPGCDSMQFGGNNSETNSYNSTAALGANGKPVQSASGGNVGSNGNLSLNGGATVNGKLSTPRSGVGACTANNVTAETVIGNGSQVTGDGCMPQPDCSLVPLPQQVVMPDPAVISPMPPVGGIDMKKTSDCTGFTYCSVSANGLTFTPTTSSTVVSLGDVTINAGAVIHLKAGIYEWNSITANGNAQIVVDSGPVVFRIAGKGQATPIDMSGGVITNTTYDPMNLQFIFAPDAADIAAIEAGTLSKDIKLAGGAGSSAVVYAPRGDGTLVGGSDLYGAVIFRKVKDMGGTKVHYDRNLQRTGLTSGNPTMTSFNWSAN